MSMLRIRMRKSGQYSAERDGAVVSRIELFLISTTKILLPNSSNALYTDHYKYEQKGKMFLCTI